MKCPLSTPEIGQIYGFGPHLIPEEGHHVVARRPDTNSERYTAPMIAHDVSHLVNTRALQFGLLDGETRDIFVRSHRHILDEPILDGRSFLVHGLGHTMLSFRTYQVQHRPPGGSLTFFTAGEGRALDEMIELAERDFPTMFQKLGDLGIHVRLADEITLPNGSVGYPQHPYTQKPILPMFKVEETAAGAYRKVAEGHTLADLGYIENPTEPQGFTYGNISGQLL